MHRFQYFGFYIYLRCVRYGQIVWIGKLRLDSLNGLNRFDKSYRLDRLKYLDSFERLKSLGRLNRLYRLGRLGQLYLDWTLFIVFLLFVISNAHIAQDSNVINNVRPDCTVSAKEQNAKLIWPSKLIFLQSCFVVKTFLLPFGFVTQSICVMHLCSYQHH